MTDEAVLPALWSLIPDHLAAAAADNTAGADLGAEDIARVAGASTPQQQAAVIRAVAAHTRECEPALSRTEIDMTDRVERLRGRDWRNPPKWNGIVLCCPKGSGHPIQPVALRFDEEWQLVLVNAARDSQQYHRNTITNVSQGHDESERLEAGQHCELAASRLRTHAKLITESAGTRQSEISAVILETAVQEVLDAIKRKDPTAVLAAMEPAHQDPVFAAHEAEHPIIKLLITLEDEALRAAGPAPHWTRGHLTDTLQLKCTNCPRYRGVWAVRKLVAMYAKAINHSDTRIRLPS